MLLKLSQNTHTGPTDLLVILTHTFILSFIHFHTLFTHFSDFGLFWLILDLTQRVVWLKACTPNGKFDLNTFIHFHTLLDTFTHTLHTFHTFLEMLGNVL